MLGHARRIIESWERVGPNLTKEEKTEARAVQGPATTAFVHEIKANLPAPTAYGWCELGRVPVDGEELQVCRCCGLDGVTETLVHVRVSGISIFLVVENLPLVEGGRADELTPDGADVLRENGTPNQISRRRRGDLIGT